MSSPTMITIRGLQQLWRTLTGRKEQSHIPSADTDGRLNQEEPNDYGRGGLHRVKLGDKFNNQRYTILRKIGYGQYSTVWLAFDSK